MNKDKTKRNPNAMIHNDIIITGGTKSPGPNKYNNITDQIGSKIKQNGATLRGRPKWKPENTNPGPGTYEREEGSISKDSRGCSISKSPRNSIQLNLRLSNANTGGFFCNTSVRNVSFGGPSPALFVRSPSPAGADAATAGGPAQ